MAVANVAFFGPGPGGPGMGPSGMGGGFGFGGMPGPGPHGHGPRGWGFGGRGFGPFGFGHFGYGHFGAGPPLMYGRPRRAAPSRTGQAQPTQRRKATFIDKARTWIDKHFWF